VLERNELEVHGLNEWPEHPVLGESIPVGRLDLLLGIRTLHDSHRGQEGEQVERSKDGLIETDTSKNLSVGRARDTNAALQEAEPGGSERTEDSCNNSEFSQRYDWYQVSMDTYLHRRAPCEHCGQDRGSSSQLARHPAEPWYHQLRRGPSMTVNN
jgi:hypothetical protein